MKRRPVPPTQHLKSAIRKIDKIVWKLSLTECAFCLAVERHAMQAARIVTHLLAVLAFHRHQILFFVRALDAGILSRLDAVRFAASRVAHNVATVALLP